MEPRRKHTGRRLWLLMLLLSMGFTASAGAQQFFTVDCSGANPAAYPTINAALAAAANSLSTVVTSTTFIVISGTCNENVYLNGATNIDIGAYYGTSITLNGSISVTGSNNVFLYGLNVTNPYGDAFDVSSSHNVTLDSCTGNGDAGLGLNAAILSDVTVTGTSSFDRNGAGGIQVNSGAIVLLNPYVGSVDISGNTGGGVWLSDGSLFQTLGSTTIENNINSPSSTTPSGYGINFLGASKGQIGTCYGPNVIQGNQAGGIAAAENAEVSLWNCGDPYQSFITGNGPTGISAGLGAQITLYNNVQISGHTESGVELYGKSQLNVFGTNLITQNGSAGDKRSAGILVDGNSEAYLRGGQIQGNQGPGILALMNSSVDSATSTFTANTGGVITCDSSAYWVSDLPQSSSGSAAGVACLTPHRLGNRHGTPGSHAIPNNSALKSKVAQYKAMASRKP